MLNLQWTLLLARAFVQLVSGFSRHVITVALSLVTRFTKVRITPTEPLGDGAAKLALELYEVGSVFWTILYAASNSDGRALSAYKFFPLETVIVVLAHFTVLFASKVRLLTFETLVIGEFIQSVRLDIFVMNIRRVIEFLVFGELFELGSVQRLFDDDLLEFLVFVDQVLYFGVVWALDSLFALWAVQIIKDYSGTIPLLLNLLLEAIHVINMAASEFRTGCLTKS